MDKNNIEKGITRLVLEFKIDAFSFSRENVFLLCKEIDLLKNSDVKINDDLSVSIFVKNTILSVYEVLFKGDTVKFSCDLKKGNALSHPIYESFFEQIIVIVSSFLDRLSLQGIKSFNVYQTEFFSVPFYTDEIPEEEFLFVKNMLNSNFLSDTDFDTKRGSSVFSFVIPNVNNNDKENSDMMIKLERLTSVCSKTPCTAFVFGLSAAVVFLEYYKDFSEFFMNYCYPYYDKIIEYRSKCLSQYLRGL